MSNKTFKIVDGDLSDGFHTFNELYTHRILLFLACVQKGVFKASHVVEDHFDGWDLIVTHTATNYQQISYHVPLSYRWAYEKLPRLSKQEQEKIYDGHTGDLVCHRIEMAIRHADEVPENQNSDDRKGE